MVPAASTTAIVTAMGASMWSVLADNIGIVFGVVVAVALVFWVFRRLLGFFTGGKR
jgi:hypothetical protein